MVRVSEEGAFHHARSGPLEPRREGRLNVGAPEYSWGKPTIALAKILASKIRSACVPRNLRTALEAATMIGLAEELGRKRRRRPHALHRRLAIDLATRVEKRW
jgi:hypothetical protein